MKRIALLFLFSVLLAGTVLAQPNVPASNSACAGVSSTGYVNWPQFHFDVCHTGYNPNEFLLSTTTVGNLVLDWQSQYGGDIYSSPALLDGVLYVTSQSLYAYDARSGALLWNFQAGDLFRGSPAVGNGMVYAASLDGKLYALNAKTGSPVWSKGSVLTLLQPGWLTGCCTSGVLVALCAP